MGGTKSGQCNREAAEIWAWCESKSIWLSAAHIPGKLNVEADFHSQNFNQNKEWALSDTIFNQICSIWGSPQIDLFASRLCHQLQCYVAWKPDPFACYIDAFSETWNLFSYIFPPFSLVGKAVRKVINDNIDAIVVAPRWPTKPWFTLLTRMEHIIFPAGPGNLVNKINNEFPGDASIRQTQIIAARYYAKH